MIVAVVAVVLAVVPWWLDRTAPPDCPQRRWGRWRRSGRGVVGSGRRPAGPSEVPDPAVVLDLVDVALAAGASIPDALHGLGAALAPAQGAEDLTAAGTALRLGASWAEAWAGSARLLEPLVTALEPAWVDGADPGPLVRRAAAGVRARRHRAAREAAERLGARLVLPLGLCFLPAFVLLSLVPVLLSGGRSLLGG